MLISDAYEEITAPSGQVTRTLKPGIDVIDILLCDDALSTSFTGDALDAFMAERVHSLVRCLDPMYVIEHREEWERKVVKLPTLPDDEEQEEEEEVGNNNNNDNANSVSFTTSPDTNEVKDDVDEEDCLPPSAEDPVADVVYRVPFCAAELLSGNNGLLSKALMQSPDAMATLFGLLPRTQEDQQTAYPISLLYMSQILHRLLLNHAVELRQYVASNDVLESLLANAIYSDVRDIILELMGLTTEEDGEDVVAVCQAWSTGQRDLCTCAIELVARAGNDGDDDTVCALLTLLEAIVIRYSHDPSKPIRDRFLSEPNLLAVHASCMHAFNTPRFKESCTYFSDVCRTAALQRDVLDDSSTVISIVALAPYLLESIHEAYDHPIVREQALVLPDVCVVSQLSSGGIAAIDLLNNLLQLRSDDICDAMVEKGCIPRLLRLLGRYPHHSILHCLASTVLLAVVHDLTPTRLVQSVFRPPNSSEGDGVCLPVWLAALYKHGIPQCGSQFATLKVALDNIAAMPNHPHAVTVRSCLDVMQPSWTHTEAVLEKAVWEKEKRGWFRT
eukprot:PhM_4_TR725/c0_g1_i1/m.81957